MGTMNFAVWISCLVTSLTILPFTHSLTPISVCRFIPQTTYSPGDINMSLAGYAFANSDAVYGVSPSYSVIPSEFDITGMEVFNEGTTGPDFVLDFSIEIHDTASSPDKVKISMTFLLNSSSPQPLDNLTMEIDVGTHLQATWDTGIPAGSVITARREVSFTNSSGISPGQETKIHFLAEPIGEGGKNLPVGDTHITGSVYFAYNSALYSVINPTVCVVRETNEEESIIYQHGFTVLVFFIMFFVGIALAILCIWLYRAIKRRRHASSVSPSKYDEKRMGEKGRKVLLDAKAAMRKGTANTIKDFSLISWNDSIVFILSMKDKFHMYRELDNLDILSTIHVDTDLETEQNSDAIQASQLLVQGLRYNEDITKGTEDKANSNMQNRLKDLDKKLDAEYKKDLESVYTDIEAKNKEKLGEMMRRHKEESHDVLRVIKDVSDEEKKQMMDVIHQQNQVEENELTYRLALEQNEEAEKLRKEYAIRKPMGIKEVQQLYIGDIVTEGNLNQQKAEWLIKLHKEKQDSIHRMYDDEISKQRMTLEEKLARRKALAQASETQEDDQTEMLNLIASLHINLVQRMKKSNNLTPDQIDAYMSQAKTDLQNVKTKMDADQQRDEKEMFKNLSNLKRKSLAEKINEHKAELDDYAKRSKSQQTEGPVDPVSYVKGLVEMKSRHRKELATLENQIDRDHAQQLEQMRNQVSDNAKKDLDEIQRNLVASLKEDGVRDEVIDKMLKNHNKNMAELSAKQLAYRRDQDARLKDELARRKREWEARKSQEKKEQQDLRDHESEIVDKMLNSQVSISEAEKDRILKEHEKQMVKLENSLTLNKLKQQRMLEEKIAQKRAKQIAELQQKQDIEIIKQRRIAENNGEEDDEETQRNEIKLMKRHTEQKMALLQGQQLNFDAELEDIRMEMTKERALALKDQEERLGALITSLQMDKAREMSQIEEQQKAINNLKANLMDDLNARGILSTPECEKILNVHKEEQDKMNRKLDGQRAKHEKALRMKLAERMQQRENSIVQHQEEEMKQLINKVTNKTAAKIRRTILMHKHMVQMEKFRNKMDREISQTLEDTKRDFEIQKQKIVQEQELEFIAGLVKVGNFSVTELTDVLHMLFPGKTEEAITDMLNKIAIRDNKQVDGQPEVQSTLADRIYTATYSNPTPLNRRGSVMSLSSSTRSSMKRSSRKGSKRSSVIKEDFPTNKFEFGPQDNTTARSRMRDDYDIQEQYDAYQDRYRDQYADDDRYSKRKDSYSQSYRNMAYDEEDEGEDINYDRRQQVSGKLPPLRDQGKQSGKKKKKLLQKLAHNADTDDDDLL